MVNQRSLRAQHGVCSQTWPSLDRGAPWRNLPFMKASRDRLRAEPGQDGSAVREAAPQHRAATEHEFDVSLLEDSLAKTPWERMQANDDALRFADALRDAIERRNAKPQRADAQAD
jgi:hypothetical protein